MKSLIMLGGIPYSGKSSLGERIRARWEGRCTYINFDRLFHETASRGEIFFKYLEGLNKQVHDSVVLGSLKNGVGEKDEMLKDFARAVISKEQGLETFQFLLQSVALVYLADRLRELDTGVVVEGRFTNRKNRQGTYEQIKSNLARFSYTPNLDEVQKVFLFINLGLNNSLERYKKGRTNSYASICTSEKEIRGQYSVQSIPSSKELPNLDVIVISSAKEVNSAVEKVGKYF